MPGAHQHPAGPRDQRKDVAGPHEIGSAAVVIREGAYSVTPFLCRNSSGQTVANVYRHCECGAKRRLVFGDHRLKMQAASLLGTKRRADNSRSIADDECHLVGRAMRGRDKEIALVFAVIIVSNHDNFAFGERPDRGFDALMVVPHGFYLEDLKCRA